MRYQIVAIVSGDRDAVDSLADQIHAIPTYGDGLTVEFVGVESAEHIETFQPWLNIERIETW
jgi:hypothetical protein